MRRDALRRTFFAASCLGALLAGPGNASAQEMAAEGPWIWPAPALYGFEGGSCDPDRSTTQTRGAVVDPLFCPDLAIEQRSVWGQRFADAMARNFPQVEREFGAHLPAGATPSARLRSTLAASIRLGRATYVTVPKPGGLDAYLPVTLTLDITNPATGEVVFTRSRTGVAQGAYAQATVEQQLARQFRAHLDATMQALVAEAAGEFRPYSQQARVLGNVAIADGQTGYVIDAGRDDGLRAGDSIGADASVIHAGADYAVVRPILGELAQGQVLSRIATAPVEKLARPTVLTVVEDGPAEFPLEWLTGVFEDSLGERGSLAPVPVNPAFAALRTFALSGAEQGLPLDERSLPDYVAQVRVVLMDPADWASKVPGVTVERFEALAFVTLSDASGRAVGGWQGRGLIEDEVSGGIRMPAWQRREAVVRNALSDVAAKMAGFKPVPRTLPVSRSGTQILIEDPGGIVPLGLTLPVMRPSGRFSGVKEEVLIPVGEVNTTVLGGGGVLATDAGIRSLSIRGKDVVALETSGNAVATRMAITHCTDADGKPAQDDRGQVPMTAFAAASEAMLAANMSAALRLAPLAGRGAAYAPSFAGWGQYRAAAPVNPEVCFLPIIAVTPDDTGYRVVTGYSLHRGASALGEKVGAKGLQTIMTPSALPEGTNAATLSALLQSNLAEEILPVTGRAAAALAINE